MPSKEVILTQEGFDKLEAEYKLLKNVRRGEVSERIRIAKGFGDLSENAEYDAAKNEQAQVEERIYKLQEMLAHAKIIKEEEIDDQVVGVGSHVKIRDLEFDEVEEYIVVGSTEADPFQNRISNESPVGRALLGHSAGEFIDVEVPNGEIVKYEILEISR